MSNLGINYITLLEGILIIGIIVYQLFLAYLAYKKVKNFSSIIPDKSSLSVWQRIISSSEDSLSNTDISVSQINFPTSIHSVFKDTIEDINSYLSNNYSVATDFISLKDITERHLEVEDEAIQQSLSVPLYLGLMGTILGIIFGLANLFFVSNSENNFEIKGFLVGVAIAMLASLIGLIVTVYNSNYAYKKARIQFDKEKNQFYNFIQIKLLSQEDQKVSADVISIHNSITDFNTNFSRNIQNLEEILLKNYDAVIAQDAILEKLDKVDIYKFAEANAIVFRELKEGTTEFQKLNSNVKTLNSSIEGTAELTYAFNALLQETNNFKSLAQKLDQGAQTNIELGEFLRYHFTTLEKRGDILDSAVQNYDDMLFKSLVALRKYTEDSVETIKAVIRKEEDLLAKSFEKYSSELSYLPLLNDLNEKSDELRTSLADKLETNEATLAAILEELKKAQASNNDENIKIESLKTEIHDTLESNGGVLLSILEELKKDNESEKSNNSESQNIYSNKQSSYSTEDTLKSVLTIEKVLTKILLLLNENKEQRVLSNISETYNEKKNVELLKTIENLFFKKRKK